jgi:LemA protein
VNWVVWVILGIVVLVLIGGVVSYNRFVRQKNLVQESWQQIDVELTRRHDLIPNLVETVKGYAAHERGTLEAVTAARAAASAPGSTPAQQAQQENVLTGALRQLFAVAESYPDLKASTNFLDLQRQLSETEDRIAAGRRFYNANVRALNTRVQAFPSSVIASVFGFKAAEYFEADDPNVRANPQVSF